MLQGTKGAVISAGLLLGSACGSLTTYVDTGTDPGSDSSSDTGSDTDTDTSSGTDSATGTAPPGHTAPVLQTLVARETNGAIEVGFRVQDAENDLVGGSFALTVDGARTTLAVPTDIDYWSPQSESKILAPISPCDVGTRSITGAITDAYGLASNQLQTLLPLSGPDFSVTEIGDASTSASMLGTLSLPVLICGDLYAASNDSVNVYTGDLDWMRVSVGSTRTTNLTLTWDSLGGDYDLHVLDASDAPVADSIQDGGGVFEHITTTLMAGQTYNVGVAGWSGPGGRWALLIE